MNPDGQDAATMSRCGITYGGIAGIAAQPMGRVNIPKNVCLRERCGTSVSALPLNES